MLNFFNRITKAQQEQMFFENGVLDKEGRLTDEGMKTFVDLLFIGKTPEEARNLIQKEIEKEIERKK